MNEKTKPKKTKAAKKPAIIDMLPDTYERCGSKPAGSGGFADVWKVRHTAWNKELAVKIPKKRGQTDIIENECNKWIDLGSHPNIATCYYVRRIEGVPCIFCEWCGTSLRSLIDEQQDVLFGGDDDEVRDRLLGYSMQIMLGLKYTHSYGKFYHSDIKPDNILLGTDGELKITDFGLAGIKGSGTPAYISPEQKSALNGGKETVTYKTDTYSWALTVLEMISGGKAWKESNKAHEFLEGLDMRDINMPEGFKSLLLDCMEPDPVLRPDDDEIIERLSAICGGNCKDDTYKDLTAADLDFRCYETPEFCVDRALSLIDLGRTEEAAGLFDKALGIYPGHSAARYNKALLDWDEGRTDDEDLLQTIGGLEDPAVKEYAEKRTGRTGIVFLRGIDISNDPNAPLLTYSGEYGEFEEYRYYDVCELMFSEDSRYIKAVHSDGTASCFDLKGVPVPEKGHRWAETLLSVKDACGREIGVMDDMPTRSAKTGTYIGDRGTKGRLCFVCPTENVKTFSPDGSLYAYADDTKIALFRADLGGKLGYMLCDIQTTAQLLNRRKSFDSAAARFEACTSDAERIAMLPEFEELKRTGGSCLREYRKAVMSLYPRCRRSNFRLGEEIVHIELDGVIRDVEISSDGKTAFAWIRTEHDDECIIIDTETGVKRSLLFDVYPPVPEYYTANTAAIDLGNSGFDVLYTSECVFRGDPDCEDNEIGCFALTYRAPDYDRPVRTTYKDPDEYFMMRGQHNVTPFPQELVQLCDERGFENYAYTDGLTHIAAAVGDRELIVCCIDCDLFPI